MPTTYLSWDCAYKSLAHIYVTVDEDAPREFFTCINNIIKEAMYVSVSIPVDTQYLQSLRTHLEDANKLFDNYMTILSYDVVDLAPNRNISDVSEVERTKLLKAYLDGGPISNVKIDPATRIIIEHQPSKIGKFTANNVSTTVSYQLAMYYADFDIAFADPRAKNNITFVGKTVPELVVEFARNRKNLKGCQYAARKLHSTNQFIHWMRVLGRDDILKQIPPRFLDDVADAFMQLVVRL